MKFQGANFKTSFLSKPFAVALLWYPGTSPLFNHPHVLFFDHLGWHWYRVLQKKQDVFPVKNKWLIYATVWWIRTPQFDTRSQTQRKTQLWRAYTSTFKGMPNRMSIHHAEGLLGSPFKVRVTGKFTPLKKLGHPSMAGKKKSQKGWKWPFSFRCAFFVGLVSAWFGRVTQVSSWPQEHMGVQPLGIKSTAETFQQP